MSDYPRRRGCIAYLSPKSNFHLKKIYLRVTYFQHQFPFFSLILQHETGITSDITSVTTFRSWFRKVCQKEELCNIHFM